ncbi:MAG: hypothetical protein EHM93_10505 [Bacteroidales bacterium]|nr:MAG: hypothetical protein EHM93_10505 [Bacteroidales bacterium]
MNSFKNHISQIIQILAIVYLCIIPFQIKGIENIPPKDDVWFKQILTNTLGALYTNPDSANQILNQSKEFIQTTDNISFKGSYYHYKGLIYQVKSNVIEALPYYLESYKLFESINDSTKTNIMQLNIGGCYMIIGQYVKAKTYLVNGLSYFEANSDSANISNACLNLSFIHIELGDFALAEECLNKALNHVKEPIKKGRILSNLGEIHLQSKEYKEAYNSYRQAIKYSNEGKDNMMVSMILSNIGVLYMVQNKVDSARHYFRKVIERDKSFVEDYLLAQSYQKLATIEKDAGNIEVAISYINKSLEIAKANKIAKVIADNYSWLSDFYSKRPDFRQAYIYKIKANEINDSLFNEAKSRQIKEIEAVYQNEQKQAEIKILSEENKTNLLQLRSNRITIISLTLGVAFILLVSVLLFRQHKLKTSANSLQLEHKLLRSQLNPHFIFNALGAIQNQVLQKPAIEAATYISSFAKLMRNTLSSSRSELIALDSDIETLTEYLSLQKLRLKDKLQYQFTTDIPCETSEIAIPPMILQPFIENAVEHGIAKKDIAEGNIWISFKASNERMIITIDDDGVGLINNMESKTNKHESLATKITQERMLALTKSYKKEFCQSITNRINNEGKIIGTRVILDIPLLFLD